MDQIIFDIVWTPGCLGGAAHGVVDVLRAVNAISRLQSPTRSAPVVWRWIQYDGRPLTSSHLVSHADPPQRGKRRKGQSADVIVVPGWIARDGPDVDEWVRRAQALLPRLRQTLDSGGALMGVFTGVALLAASGALSGRRATAPWPFIAPVLRQALACPGGTPDVHAPVEWVDNALWTSDRSVWTCASPAAVTEATLDLMACTPWAALSAAARDVLLPNPLRQGAAMANARSAGESLASSRVPTGMVERARQWLIDHLAEPYDMHALAMAAATSARSLTRHFGATHGMSPYQYLERLRVERASLMLQTSYLSVEEIGRAVGMPSPSTLRRVFLRHTSELPGEYRHRYRLRMQRPRWGSAPDGAQVSSALTRLT